MKRIIIKVLFAFLTLLCLYLDKYFTITIFSWLFLSTKINAVISVFGCAGILMLGIAYAVLIVYLYIKYIWKGKKDE
jgi:hypothetical protein